MGVREGDTQIDKEGKGEAETDVDLGCGQTASHPWYEA